MNNYDRIKFEWHGRGPNYDCIGLADLIRRGHHQRPIDLAQIEWIYEAHPTLDESPLNLVAQLAETLAHPVTHPTDYDLAVITNHGGRSCLGTLFDGKLVAFTGDRVRVVTVDRFVARMAQVEWIRLDEGFLQKSSRMSRPSYPLPPCLNLSLPTLPKP